MNTNILDYGAVPDGRVCTKEIQAAIDKCFETGGGRVTVPAGTFVTGTIRLKSNVELYLDHNSRLLASTNHLDYNNEDEYAQNGFSLREGWSGRHLVICVEQENVAITGTGTIDGNSKEFMEEAKPCDFTYHWRYGKANSKNKEILRPGQMVCFIESKNIKIQGVNLINASCWTLFIHGCADVSVKDIKIKNNHTHENTDGIDIDCCANVIVRGCIIDTGDDPLTVRCASKRLKYNDGLCENIIISDCIVSSEATGIRIGVGSGLIRNVKIANIIIKKSGEAIHFACDYLDSGCVNMENLSFSNIHAEMASVPLAIINANGANIKNISFERCTFESLRGMYGRYSENTIMKNIKFIDCTFEIATEYTGFPRINSLKKEDMGESVLDFKSVNGLLLDKVRIIIPEKHNWLKRVVRENCTPIEFE